VRDALRLDARRDESCLRDRWCGRLVGGSEAARIEAHLPLGAHAPAPARARGARRTALPRVVHTREASVSPRMSARPTETVFMPGFDGVGELRREFVEALGAIAPASAIRYPNRTLESLNGYARFASSHVSPESRPVLVAESFSGLVAARWAAQDPHVAGLVLC